ncbi:hypothetical protein D3C80_1916710 [compost metagenome]
MVIELALSITSGDSIWVTKVNHIEGTARHDTRNASMGYRIEAIFVTGQHTTKQVVADFGSS